MAVVNKEMMQTIRSLTAEVREQRVGIDSLYRTQEAMRLLIFRTMGVDPLAMPANNSDSEMRVMQIDEQMDRASKESSSASADSGPADGAALGSETQDNAEQMEMMLGGSVVCAEIGADVCRQDIAEADEQGVVVEKMGMDNVGTADSSAGIGSADTIGGDGSVGGTANDEGRIDYQSADTPCRNEDELADNNGTADDNGAADKVSELRDISAMTDGGGDVAMDDHVSIHDQVRSSESVPSPAPCPPSDVPLAQAPIASPVPPVSTPATPIDSIESGSVQPGSQADGELVGYSSSTSSSSEMN